MKHQAKNVNSSAVFYGALALCLIGVGVGTWALLHSAASRVPAVTASAGENLPAEQSQVLETPEEPVIVGAVESRRPEKSEKVQMPELPVETVADTPVIAETPRVVVAPLEGEVVAAFSMDALQYNETLADWRTHDGMDIAAAEGTKVLAACSGTVEAVLQDDLLGSTVVLKHPDGWSTVYANLEVGAPVQAGDSVSAGQTVGTVGNTALSERAEGPHLHFAVFRNGTAQDPAAYLNG